MIIICEDEIHIAPTLSVSYKLVRRQLEIFKVHSFWDTDFSWKNGTLFSISRISKMCIIYR